jgi:PilZ domain
VFFFGDDDYEGEGKLLDISTSGCRISSDETLAVGTGLKLSLFLKDHQWPMRIDEAIVRWAKVDTYGIEFTSIRLAQRERIRALVMKDRS